MVSPTMRPPATLPEPIAREVDLRRLASWMEARGLGHGPVTHAEPLTGGTQNIMLRVVQGGRTYVFRRPPANPRPFSQDALRREAHVLGALAGTEVPHPRLVASEPDEAALGYAFLLMEMVDGFNPGEGLPARHRAEPDLRRRMGESYVDALADLAEVDVRAVGLSDIGRGGSFLARQVPQWRGHLERYAAVPGWRAGDLPHANALAGWLERHRPADAAPGLIHGDCHLGNTLFARDSGEIAALVDWEMSTVGDPRLDLGWVMATWPFLGAGEADDGTIGLPLAPRDGFPTLDALVARYAARTSRRLDAAPWFGVLACFKLGVLLEGTRVRALAGKVDAAVGERLHGAAVRLMARGRRWAV